jgi:hypothetical protein
MPEMNARRFTFFLTLIYSIWNPLCGQSSAYTLVHEEDHHIPIFQNDQIRVLNVRASQGDTTAFHRHCNPILYITLEGTTVSLKEPTTSWKKTELPSGWIGQDIYHSDSCFVHRFAIPGQGRLHIVAVEALKHTEEVSLSTDPIHSEEGFSVYEIGLSHLGEMIEVSIPIILVETSCNRECKVEVINSEKLSKELLQKHNAYAVFFKKPDIPVIE